MGDAEQRLCGNAFSGLNQITPANVSKLALSFTFSTATTHGYEAPPLVVNGTMYLITPFPNSPLDGIALRVIVAGKLANKPENMEKWIRNPQQVSPGTAMPDLNVGDRDAGDITAFLYTRTK